MTHMTARLLANLTGEKKRKFLLHIFSTKKKKGFHRKKSLSEGSIFLTGDNPINRMGMCLQKNHINFLIFYNFR
jgi:hypothetical protein